MIEPENPKNQAVQSLFTENAENYASLFAPAKTGSSFGFGQRLELATKMSEITSGNLLDCACGPGEITTAILASGRFKSATLVDLSPKMLSMAEQRLGDALNAVSVDFQAMDVFEFASKATADDYNLILCLGLIAHTGRLDELLMQLKRLLAPGGRILLQTTLYDHWGIKVVRSFTERRYYRHKGYHISYFKQRDIVASVQNAGLDIESVCRYGVAFPFGDKIWPWANYQLERALRSSAAAYGAEALYLLKK